MSSFQEINGLLRNEIMNSPQYQIAIKIKDLVIQDIITPNINCIFMYQLQNTDYVDIENKNKEQEIIKLALKLVFGFEVDISMDCVSFAMNKFL
jgi:hypothetical protein